MASIYKRGKTWWLKYHLDGAPVRESLKTRDKRKAERLRAKKELEVAEGTAEAPAKAMTIERFVKLYQDHYVTKGRRDRGMPT